MTNFSPFASNVRVDFFRPSGKWHTTSALDMKDRWDQIPLHQAIQDALNEQYGDQYDGLIAVVLEPYHEHPHPIMVVKGVEEQPTRMPVAVERRF